MPRKTHRRHMLTCRGVSALLAQEPWRRNEQVAVAMVFVVFTGFAFVLPFLPLYVRQLGVTDPETAVLWSGVLLGIAPLLAGLLAPVWGRVADRHGHKTVAVKALVAYVVILVLCALVTSVGQLLVLRIGIGLFGGIGPLGLAMAASLAPREQTGRAVGAVQAAQILSAAVGPFAGGLLADLIGIRSTFLVTAVLCLATLALVVFAYREAPAAEGAEKAASASFMTVLRLPSVPRLLAVLFLVNFIGRSFTPILPLHLQQLGVSSHRLAFSTGLLISVYAVAAAVSAAVLGRATRRLAPETLLVATLLGGAVAVAPMSSVPSLGGLMALAALLGLLSGGSLTLCYTIGGLLVPAGLRSTAFGFFSGAALFGGSLSPSFAGLVAHWKLTGIYEVDAVLYVLLAGALVLTRPRPAPPA
jgi:DHA1 family multidrug resistance protein-like MFS transporter